MAKNLYPKEKFSTAISIMASSPLSIQDRLHMAYMSFHPVLERDFDEPEVRAACMEIMDTLTAIKHDPLKKGTVRVTLDQMSDEDASALADKIISFYFLYLVD